MHDLQRVFAVCLMGWAISSAQTAVITLIAPPPGGDGYSALQSGVAIPSGSASAWYNPALLPSLKATTGSTVHAGYSRQDLVFGTSQEYFGAAAVYPVGEGTIGVGIYQNHTDMGATYPPNGSRNEERVSGFAAGATLGRSTSAGLSTKFFRSKIGSGEATGWAFDLGLAAVPRLRPFGSLPSLEVVPSFGTVVQNLGPDVWYVDPGLSDPLPRTWKNGIGLETEFADFVSVSVGYDLEKPVDRHASWKDSWQRTSGISAALFGFRYGTGWLDDPDGKRHERHVMREYEFNLQRVLRVVRRVREGDIRSAGTPAAMRIPRTSLVANPRFVVGKREIVSGARDGQDGWYFSLSM